MKVLNVYEFTMKDVYDGLLNGVAHRLSSRGILNDLHKWGEDLDRGLINVPIGGELLHFNSGALLRITVVEVSGEVYLEGAVTTPSGVVLAHRWQDDMGKLFTSMHELPDNPTAMLLKELESASLDGGVYTIINTSAEEFQKELLELKRSNSIPDFIRATGTSTVALTSDYDRNQVPVFLGEYATVGFVRLRGVDYSIVTFMFGPLEIVPCICVMEDECKASPEEYLEVIELIEEEVLKDYPEGCYISRDL